MILTCVCKSCGFVCPVIEVSCPAVRLYTNGDVDLCNFKRTAYVADTVIIRCISVSTAYDSIFRSDCCDTCVDTSRCLSCLCISIYIGVIKACQGISIKKAFYRHLVAETLRKSKCRPGVLLSPADNCDSSFLLIVQSKDKSAALRHHLCYLV